MKWMHCDYFNSWFKINSREKNGQFFAYQTFDLKANTIFTFITKIACNILLFDVGLPWAFWSIASRQQQRINWNYFVDIISWFSLKLKKFWWRITLHLISSHLIQIEMGKVKIRCHQIQICYEWTTPVQ